MYKYETSKPVSSQWVWNGAYYINLNYIVYAGVFPNDRGGFDMIGFSKEGSQYALNKDAFETEKEANEWFNEIITQSR